MRSKSNFRRGRNSGWASFRRFEDEVAIEVRRFLPEGWEPEPVGTPLGQRPRYASVIAARSVVDAGNFPKSVLDACEGIVFTNDAQVQLVTAVSERGRREPYLLIAFAQLDPSLTIREAALAGSALLTICMEEIEDRRDLTDRV
jgi:hypothetical protein